MLVGGVTWIFSTPVEEERYMTESTPYYQPDPVTIAGHPIDGRSLVALAGLGILIWGLYATYKVRFPSGAYPRGELYPMETPRRRTKH